METTNGKPGNRQPDLLILCKLFSHLAGTIDCLARGEVVQLKELANLDFAFLTFTSGVRGALGPFDGLFSRLYLDDPVSCDQFFAFCERAVYDRALTSRELDAGTFGTGLK